MPVRHCATHPSHRQISRSYSVQTVFLNPDRGAHQGLLPGGGGSITGGGASSSPYKTAGVALFHQFIRHNFPHE